MLKLLSSLPLLEEPDTDLIMVVPKQVAWLVLAEVRAASVSLNRPNGVASLAKATALLGTRHHARRANSSGKHRIS